jgi:ABC-type antimicrobial peptide transport system permease subunit
MKLEFTIPESWADIKLSDYLAYAKALKPYEGSEEYHLAVYEKGINHFCGVSTDVLRSLPMENYNSIIGFMKDLFEKETELPVILNFEIAGTKYGFLPKLDNMTYGEYLDLSSYSKDLWQNLATFISIIYRPVTKEDRKGNYEIEPYSGTDDDTIDLFKNALTMDIVWGAIGFFTRLQKDLLNAMATYSIQSLKIMQKDLRLLETLTKNGVDTSVLQSCQETISQSLKPLLD